MSRIRISHTTAYRYSEPVSFGIHRLVIRPREGHDLQVETLSLKVSPAAAVSWHRDIFGNSIGLASFSEPADLLEFSSEAVVCRRDHTSHRRLLDVLPIKFPVRYSEMEASVAEGYLKSVYHTESAKLREWAEATFAANSGDDAVLLVEKITEWIHRSIRYRRREDRGVQSPLETLQLRSGSCRDMATLLLEAARALRRRRPFRQRIPGRRRLPRWSGRHTRLGGGLFPRAWMVRLRSQPRRGNLRKTHCLRRQFASARGHAGEWLLLWLQTQLSCNGCSRRYQDRSGQQRDQRPERSHRCVATANGFRNELKRELRKYAAKRFRTAVARSDCSWSSDLSDRLYNRDAGDRAHSNSHDHRDSFLDNCARRRDDGGGDRLLMSAKFAGHHQPG